MEAWKKKPERTRISFQLHNKNGDDEMCAIKSIREANAATQSYIVISQLHHIQNAAIYFVIQELLRLWVRPQGIKLEKMWNLHVQERPGSEQMTQITNTVAAIRRLYFLSLNVNSVPETQIQPCLVFHTYLPVLSSSCRAVLQVYLSRNISKEIPSPCHQHILFISAVITTLINNFYATFPSNTVSNYESQSLRTYHHKQKMGILNKTLCQKAFTTLT